MSRASAEGRLAPWWKRWGEDRVWPSLCLPAVLAIAACFCLAHFFWWPRPIIHDEFSYLLAGETFAEGRLTNPTHPLHRYFETFGVLQEPSYMSKYPPLPGLALALGIWLGDPIYGIWLCYGLMVGSFVWMLRQWVPAGVALLGGMALAFHGQLLMSWGGNFYAGGGLLGFTFACWVYGSLGQMRGGGGWRTGILFGAGLSGLMLSRPYEGFLVALPATLIASAWLLKRLFKRRAGARVVVAAVLISFGAGVFFQGLYNHRVTGNVLQMPYTRHQQDYYRTPLFLFQELGQQKVRPVLEIQAFDESSHRPLYTAGRRWPGLWRDGLEKLLKYGVFYLGTVGLLGLLYLLASQPLARTAKSLLAVLAVSGVGLSVSTFSLCHYAGPGAPVLFLLFAFLLARSNVFRQSGGRVLLVVLALMFVEHAFRGRKFGWPEGPLNARAVMVRELEVLPGNHLVLVSYGRDHDPRLEWVYNHARIDDSRIIWARVDRADDSSELGNYYSRRSLWVLDTDQLVLKCIRDVNGNIGRDRVLEFDL